MPSPFRLPLALIVSLCAAGVLASAPAAPPAPDLPHIIFVVADDLGFGDLGCYGQRKIRTPVLDRLAREGIRLTRHYSGNAVCAPSRCVLMTGRHPGHAVVRDNREQQPEGQFPLPAGTVTLARALKDRGYATGAFGKWGLGSPGSSGDPLNQGFNRFFGFNCQRIAHNYYPTHLWSDRERVALRNQPFPSQDKLAPADVPNRDAYARFAGTDYAPDRITEQAIAFLTTHRDRPLFLYWPTTVPHLALQVPEDSVREYAGQWDDLPYPGGRGYLPHFQPRAAYAAMITRMDRDIGRLMEKVHSLGLDRRTLFIFTSDNGPLYNKLGGTDCEFFQSHGRFRGRKGSLYDGGIRVPCIVRWPGVIPAGRESDHLCGFEDWLPTLLDLIGATDPPPHLDGVSFAETLRGNRQPERAFLYREFPAYGGQQSVTAGQWKAVRQKLNALGPGSPPQTELYDLSADPREAHDVAAGHPDVVARLESIMREQHRPSPVFPMPALDR